MPSSACSRRSRGASAAWPPGGPCSWCSTTCSGPTSRRCGCWDSWPAPWPRSPVALLGAYRDTEASPELRKIAGQAQQLALAGLTQDGVGELARELAGTPLPPQVTAQLWERSGGNPFFVRELIRLLLAQGSWHQPVQIPASVAETLRRRLARLSTECVRLLEWAAIAGRDIDVGLLARRGRGWR